MELIIAWAARRHCQVEAVSARLSQGKSLEVDLGACVTKDYSDLFRGRFDPAFGVGLSVSF